MLKHCKEEEKIGVLSKEEERTVGSKAWKESD